MMLESELKRKLRALKRLEEKIRYLAAEEGPEQPVFVWDSFFSLKTQANQSRTTWQKSIPDSREQVKYPLPLLQNLERAERKKIIEHYIYEVFLKSFQEGRVQCGMMFYDSEVLSLLNMPWNASGEEIKTRFRQLAKQYHPDQGGEVEKMIKLLEAYEKIFPKKNL